MPCVKYRYGFVWEYTQATVCLQRHLHDPFPTNSPYGVSPAVIPRLGNHEQLNQWINAGGRVRRLSAIHARLTSRALYCGFVSLGCS